MSHPTTTWDVIPEAATPGALLDRDGAQVEPGVDLELDSDGDLVVDTDAHFTQGLAAVAQGLRIRCLMFRGEFFANIDFGIPYLERSTVTAAEAILGQKFDELKTLTAFREMITETPEVTSISSLTVTFDNATRILRVAYRVITTFGVVSDSVVVEV